MADTGTAADEDNLVAQALGLQHLHQLGEILDVDVLLGDRLRHDKGVGVQLNALGDKLLVRHLAAEVIGINHVVALQAVVAGIAFHVHDGIDTHSVSIRAGAGTHNDNLTADMLADILVALVHVHGG